MKNFVKKFISPLWKKEDKLSLLERYNFGSAVETIIQKYAKRGAEPETDKIKAEIEGWVKDNMKTSISLTEGATGSLRQWLNIRNNGYQTHFASVLIDPKVNQSIAETDIKIRFLNPSNPF